MKPGKTSPKKTAQPSPAEVQVLMTLLNTGRHAEVENRARALLGLFPVAGSIWKLLAISLHMQGKDPLLALQKAAHLLPGDVGMHYNLGNTLIGLGQFQDAAASYRRALHIKPDFAEAHNELGNALNALGQFEQAVASCRRALKINPGFAEAHSNLGNAQRELGQYQDAVSSYHRALQLKPDFAEVHGNLGNALRDIGQLDDAVASYRRAVELKPDSAISHSNLGNALKELGQLDGAVAHCRRAVELKPDFAEAHSNLGNALKELGQLESAVASFHRAVTFMPDSAEVHSNLGNALRDLGQLDEAMASCRRALQLKPDFVAAHWNLSLVLLTLGQYAEAWPHYEARYDPNLKDRNIFPPDLSYPQWQGESLTGKSLVVWSEQGFGDEIQFARYIPMLKTRGISRLTLVCKQPLKVLLESVPGVDAVVSLSETEPLAHHDYWTFPLSLPLHFATTVETIPAALPYLSVMPEKLDRWREQLPTQGLKVGLVWKGRATHKNDHNRSLPGLSTLAPLWSVRGVTFISLQKGPGEEEAATPPTGQPILNMSSDIQDFADTAAIVTQLDLVICVDTSIAHLAGALNKPCWVLLPASGTDWRWLQGRTDSPWYPGVMRLFRQEKLGDWAATMGEVVTALSARVDERA